MSTDERQQEIKDFYLEILDSKKEVPVYGDFSSFGITKDAIRHHFGGIERLHKIIEGEYSDEISKVVTSSNSIFSKDLDASSANSKRYLITTAVGGARANLNFLGSVRNWAQRNDGEVIIMPCEDVTNSFENETAWFDPEFKKPEYLFVTKDTALNDNLTLCNIQVSAKQIKPTTGITRIGKRDGSYIVAAPKQFLDYFPCGNSRDHRYAIMTPGACTEAKYFSNRFVSKRLSYIADHDHTIGGIIVEIDNDEIFYFRQIQAAEDGSFIDLGCQYSPDGNTVDDQECTIVYGDIHAAQLDTEAFEEFETQISDGLNVVNRVVHDLFDGLSVNHHIDTPGGKALNKDNSNLKNELKLTYEFLDSLAKKSNVTVVQSNHDEFLERYIKEGRYIDDPENHYDALKIGAMMFERPAASLLALALEYASGKPISAKMEFLSRSSSSVYGGVQLGAHGDLGMNGMKANLQSLEQIYGRCVVGHAHTPAIQRSVFRVGVMSKLDMGYNRGPSAWSHTNAIVYSNGQIQLVNRVNNRYKGREIA